MFKKKEQKQTLQVPATVPPPQPAGNQSNEINGILLVQVLQARNLSFFDPQLLQACYCLVEFDKNEFIADADGMEANGFKWSQKANFDVSRDAELFISFFQKTNKPAKQTLPLPPQPMPQQRRPQQKPALQQQNQAHYLGGCTVKPKWSESKMEELWLPIYTQHSANDLPAGEILVQMQFKKIGSKKSLTIDDFDLLKVIGKGSFGKVMQVRKKDTGRIYAMKIIRKANIVERSEVEHTLAERNVLAKIQNPFIVNLKFSFQSPDKLYLVLAFVNGGELFHHLQTEGCFAEERAKFYCAELLIALECLHKYDIIYRDLKPENILLDYTGHIALCDFGLCKLNMKQDDKTNTFCGTPEYLAPELLIGQGYTKSVDWWTLGVLLYEMVIGIPPFYSENTNEMYRKILNDPLRFPREDGSEGPVVSERGQSLLRRLLERNPEKRLGAGGSEEIKKHPFFEGVNWEQLYKKHVTPPFRPDVVSATDTSNFSPEFTSEPAQDSYVENAPALSTSVQAQFQGFTYIGNEGNAMYGASMRTNTYINRSGLGGS